MWLAYDHFSGVRASINHIQLRAQLWDKYQLAASYQIPYYTKTTWPWSPMPLALMIDIHVVNEILFLDRE